MKERKRKKEKEKERREKEEIFLVLSRLILSSCLSLSSPSVYLF
jgi:hypothetical protein